MSEISAGPGRPAIGPAVHFRLPPELLDRVDSAAERDGVSRACLIREALWHFVAQKRHLDHFAKTKAANRCSNEGADSSA